MKNTISGTDLKEWLFVRHEDEVFVPSGYDFKVLQSRKIKDKKNYMILSEYNPVLNGVVVREIKEKSQGVSRLLKFLMLKFND